MPKAMSKGSSRLKKKIANTGKETVARIELSETYFVSNRTKRNKAIHARARA